MFVLANEFIRNALVVLSSTAEDGEIEVLISPEINVVDLVVSMEHSLKNAEIVYCYSNALNHAAKEAASSLRPVLPKYSLPSKRVYIYRKTALEMKQSAGVKREESTYFVRRNMEDCSEQGRLKVAVVGGGLDCLSRKTRLDRVGNEWVLKECGLKGNPIVRRERGVLRWLGHVERMSVDLGTKKINEDIRLSEHVKGRTINLTMSSRARAALRKVGLEKVFVNQHGIPLEGRMIHSINCTRRISPYDPRSKQCIYSVCRKYLNEVLLTVYPIPVNRVGDRLYGGSTCEHSCHVCWQRRRNIRMSPFTLTTDWFRLTLNEGNSTSSDYPNTTITP
uniref:Uncharacterized protein n=1 Tax=Timema cristinae TaxID=61476 RepID=A0A7R9CBE4_TIMCR|nr:unnamed protein product [Timema cristinae]